MDGKIAIETLKKPEFLASAKKKLEDILNYDDGKEARDFAYDIEKSLKAETTFETSFPELYSGYQDIIIRLKLVALAFLTDTEIIATLKDHFSIMLLSFPSGTNDIISKLRSYLVGIPIYEERDILKEKIKKILVESQEIITNEKIKDSELGDQTPTISNWIKDYLKQKKNNEDDSLFLTVYLYNSRSTMDLSDKEREVLKSLLSLYEFLSKSYLTTEGMDENILYIEDGLLKILRQGQVEIIGPTSR